MDNLPGRITVNGYLNKETYVIGTVYLVYVIR